VAVLLIAAATSLGAAAPASAAGPFEPNDNIGQAYGPLTGAADYSAAPDLDVLTKGIRRGLAELQAQSATRRTAPARRRARS